jgi:methylthioribose-1-phosphate isomerase
MRNAPDDISELRPICWENGRIQILDQTFLPGEELWIPIHDLDALCEAIRMLRIRGAPAIGIAAAYGMALTARSAADERKAGPEELRAALADARSTLAATRPTAVNLSWALETMQEAAGKVLESGGDVTAVAEELARKAIELHEDDLDRGRRMGAHGAALLPEGAVALTHCNTGALATGGTGTALGIIDAAWRSGRLSHVYATETRPLLQGARLTVWELKRLGIPHTLIVDSAAAVTMRERGVQAVIVGADRIATNGDVANKIGTFALALEAAMLEIPFYVAAPTSTIDPSLERGALIPIEERDPDEITRFGERQTAPDDTEVFAPAFDVTPHSLVTAIVTERGVISPVLQEGVLEHL